MIYIIAALVLLAIISVFVIYVMAKKISQMNKTISEQKETIEQINAVSVKEAETKTEVEKDAQIKKETYSTGDIVDRFNASLKQLHDN